jgi:hypothetical protein
MPSAGLVPGLDVSRPSPRGGKPRGRGMPPCKALASGTRRGRCGAIALQQINPSSKSKTPRPLPRPGSALGPQTMTHFGVSRARGLAAPLLTCNSAAGQPPPQPAARQAVTPEPVIVRRNENAPAQGPGRFGCRVLTMTYFRAIYLALSSARHRFTVLFGMGRSGSSAL